MIDENVIKIREEIDERFESNKTMRLLKNQKVTEMIGSKEIQGMRDIMEAHGEGNSMEIAFEIFMLGYIYGKKQKEKKERD